MAMVFDKKQNESSEDARQAVRLEVGKGVFSMESSVEHRKEQSEGSEARTMDVEYDMRGRSR